jgi:acetylornithine deacetylase/succinyl-diaminopimelate desuccinylase-like protein
LVEQMGARPTLDVNGMWSGWTGDGAKTVLPAKAYAKVSMRLVPEQDPDEIADLFAAHVERVAPAGVSVRVSRLHGAKPVVVDRSIPAMRTATAAYERVFGRTPVLTREGGSIPVVAMLKDVLGLDTVLMGFGLPDDNLHAPNEKFDLGQYHRGIETIIEFYASLPAAGTRQ